MNRIASIMRRLKSGQATVILSLSLCLGATAAHAADSDIAVRVEVEGEIVRVDVEATVAATPKEVWEVLTDFEHLPSFVSNITSSKVLAHNGNVIRVAQQGKTHFGPLAFEFQSERELTLTPYEKFDSLMLSGNMKRFRGTTRLESAEGKTRIRYHSEALPDTALPLGLGRSLIEAETREHYTEIRREVLRRKAALAGM